MILATLQKIDKIIEKFCEVMLLIIILLMLTLTLLNISLRLFNTTILWIEPLVRHLVLVCTFLGGAIATGRRNHIGIDILGKILENKSYPQVKWAISLIITGASLVAIVWLTKAAVDLTAMEFQFGSNSFFNLHSGYLVSIIPSGFILIGYRFFFIFIDTILTVPKGVKP